MVDFLRADFGVRLFLLVSASPGLDAVGDVLVSSSKLDGGALS